MLAQFGRQFGLGNGLRLFHKPVPAVLLDLLGDMIGQIIGAGTGDILILKTPNAVELRLIHPIKQGLEFGFSLAGVADNEGRPQGDLWAIFAPGGNLIERFGRCGGAGHAFEHIGMGVLKGNVEIGQDQPLGHQRDQMAHMRVGVDIMQPHPSAQLPQFAGQIGDMRAQIALGCRFNINAIGAGVLRDHQ